MSDFVMPSLGADMDAGTLVAWHMKPGDAVKRGTVVAEVETDKGIVEVEIWEDGVVESLAVNPGTKVPVGTVLARLRSSGAAPAPIPPATARAAATRPTQPPPAPTAAPAAPATGHPLASPAARSLARELGVDLSSVEGSGPHGAITRGDVERKSHPPSAPPPPVVAPAPTTEVATSAAAADGSAMRRAIAAAMTRSKREIPHYYLATEIEVQRAQHWLELHNASRSVTERTLFAALLLKATALAVREVPEVNGFYSDGSFHPSAGIHLGVAISLRQGGLVAPAIHDVDGKTVDQVQASLRDLVARARTGRLRSSEMTDPTLTVTNLGDQGALSVFGVIYPPQVALVGFGRVTQRPWAQDGLLGVRPVVVATLAGDHRVSDGHRGGLFLAAIARHLENPEKL